MPLPKEMTKIDSDDESSAPRAKVKGTGMKGKNVKGMKVKLKPMKAGKKHPFQKAFATKLKLKVKKGKGNDKTSNKPSSDKASNKPSSSKGKDMTIV